MPRTIQDDHDEYRRNGALEPADARVLLIVKLDTRARSVSRAIAHLAPHARIESSGNAFSALLGETLRTGASGYVLSGPAAADLVKSIDAALRSRLDPDVGADRSQRGQPAFDPDSTIEALSARERQIVQLVVRGKSSAQIGSLLHLSPKTVDSYRSRLMAKLGVTDVPALVRYAIRVGWISASEP